MDGVGRNKERMNGVNVNGAWLPQDNRMHLGTECGRSHTEGKGYEDGNNAEAKSCVALHRTREINIPRFMFHNHFISFISALKQSDEQRMS